MAASICSSTWSPVGLVSSSKVPTSVPLESLVRARRRRATCSTVGLPATGAGTLMAGPGRGSQAHGGGGRSRGCLPRCRTRRGRRSCAATSLQASSLVVGSSSPASAHAAALHPPTVEPGRWWTGAWAVASGAGAALGGRGLGLGAGALVGLGHALRGLAEVLLHPRAIRWVRLYLPRLL